MGCVAKFSLRTSDVVLRLFIAKDLDLNAAKRSLCMTLACHGKLSSSLSMAVKPAAIQSCSEMQRTGCDKLESPSLFSLAST